MDYEFEKWACLGTRGIQMAAYQVLKDQNLSYLQNDLRHSYKKIRIHSKERCRHWRFGSVIQKLYCLTQHWQLQSSTYQYRGDLEWLLPSDWNTSDCSSSYWDIVSYFSWIDKTRFLHGKNYDMEAFIEIMS